MPADRQASPVGVSELEVPLTQLASKDAVLLHQIRDRLPLLAIQPPGEDDEHHVESRRVDHRGSLQHAAKIGCSDRVGRVVGPYGQDHRIEPLLRHRGEGNRDRLDVSRARPLGGSYNLEIKRLMLAHACTFVDTVVFWVADTNWRSQRAMEKIGGVRRPELQPRFLAGQIYAHVVFEITKRDFHSSAIWS